MAYAIVAPLIAIIIFVARTTIVAANYVSSERANGIVLKRRLGRMHCRNKRRKYQGKEENDPRH